VSVDHDTPMFAATSIEAWWKQIGVERYPGARELFITADAGGSNSYRSQVWRQQLQRNADKLNLAIHVSHSRRARASGTRSSTGCSRSSRSTGVADRSAPTRRSSTSSATRPTVAGLSCARLDRRNYPIGKKVSAKELWELNIERDKFHGEWNYVIKPRTETK
jgi:hypothetical protein